METLFLKSIQKAIKHWYLPLLVGIFFIIVSIITFTSPGSSLLALTILFSLTFLFGGLSEVIFAVTNKEQLENWGWTLTLGIITTLVGILLVSNPALSVATLGIYIGFVILFRSIASISFAIDIKRYGSKGWGGMLLIGILGAIFSFILIWNPIFAGMSLVLLVGLSFLFGGLYSIILAFQLRKLHKHGKKLSTKLKDRFEELAKDIRDEWDD